MPGSGQRFLAALCGRQLRRQALSYPPRRKHMRMGRAWKAHYRSGRNFGMLAQEVRAGETGQEAIVFLYHALYIKPA